MLLDLIGADTSDDAFRKQSRGQINVIDAARQRKYNGRFTTMPYIAYKAGLPGCTVEEETRIFTWSLTAPRKDVGIYGAILRSATET